MPKTEKRTEELLEKANNLPLSPGIYIMKDKNGKVIYVGKSRKLKNRVSQYFQNSKKNTKTLKMVTNAEDFDYMICTTEIEALTLENTLIKQYSPKYNIKLKDAKSYPYIKITEGEYPKIVFTRTRNADKGKYFGPFSGASTVYSILDTIRKTLGIPNCKRVFPRDIGKDRPCIYHQIGKCCGLCTGKISSKEYARLIGCAEELLKGHGKNAIDKLEAQMYDFAEKEQYESAARCRDAIKSLKKLDQKQNVVASPDTNIDIFGLYADESFACISVMYVRDGAVVNKNDFSISADAITDSEALSAFIFEHYVMNDYVPKLIATSFILDNDDKSALEEYLYTKAGIKTELRHPERGRIRELSKICVENAEEKVKQNRLYAQKDEEVLYTLAKLLALESLPLRIEAYDISNIGSENITAGMVVFKDGKACRGDYRSFNILSLKDKADDYASMREALVRRFKHLNDDTSGSFSEYPDLILIDGGKGHVSVATEAIREFGLNIPIFGMVKDNFHKTRALCTEAEEINIAREQSVFMLIYGIQEEVHRFTVGKTTAAKRKTLKHSSLEKISGIGPMKAKRLMEAMRTLPAVKSATPQMLASVKGITATDAEMIYKYFHSETEK